MTTAPGRNLSAFWNILKILLAICLAGFVLSRTDLRQLSVLFRSISIHWLVFSITLFLSLTLLKAFQYYVLISEKVTYPQVLNVVIMQNAVSNYLAPSAGIASYLALFHIEHNVKISRSMAVFLLTKLGDLTTLWLALLLSVLMIWSRIAALQSAVIALFSLMGVVIMVFFLTLIFRQKFILLIRLAFDWLRVSQLQASQKVLDILCVLSEIEQSRLFRKLILVFGLSLLYFVLSLAWYYSTFKVFNFRVEIPAVIFVNILLQLFSYIPIQVFGGLGMTETGSLYLWGLLGINQSVLAPVLVGSRILFYLSNVLPLVYLPLYAIFFQKE